MLQLCFILVTHHMSQDERPNSKVYVNQCIQLTLLSTNDYIRRQIVYGVTVLQG